MAFGDKGWHYPLAAATVLGVVYVVASASTANALAPGPLQPNPYAGAPPAIDAGAEAARGITGILGQVIGAAAAKVARDDDARERARDRENDGAAGKDFDGDGDVSTSERNRADSGQA